MDWLTGAGSPTLAIVMPALDEEGAVGRQIEALRVHSAFSALTGTRILVVDNGSTDATAEVARAAGAEVIVEPRRGYGFACAAGVRAAEGADVVLLLDADGSDDLAGAARVAEVVLRGDADLAMGARTLGHTEAGALTPQQRAGNAVGCGILRTLYRLRVSDLGPTRAIRRDALLRLDMHEMGYGWSVEMLAKAARAGLRVAELPVDYHARTAGKSKVSGTLRGTVLASKQILGTLMRYRQWRTEWVDAAAARTPPHQALFVVVRVPTPGCTKTRLGASIGHENAAALYSAFVRDLGARLTDAARRDGYDLYWFYADPVGEGPGSLERLLPLGSALLPQVGADLGERLLHGFRSLRARGYERIAVLGSDSPQVPVAWIGDAFAALDVCDVVLGPADDGGYYLLAQRTHSDVDDLFTGITMSTPSVCQETIARAHHLGRRVRLVPRTFDVDEVPDLDRLRDVLRTASSDDADVAPFTAALLDELGVGEAVAEDALPAGAQGGERGLV